MLVNKELPHSVCKRCSIDGSLDWLPAVTIMHNAAVRNLVPTSLDIYTNDNFSEWCFSLSRPRVFGICTLMVLSTCASDHSWHVAPPTEMHESPPCLYSCHWNALCSWIFAILKRWNRSTLNSWEKYTCDNPTLHNSVRWGTKQDCLHNWGAKDKMEQWSPCSKLMKILRW